MRRSRLVLAVSLLVLSPWTVLAQDGRPAQCLLVVEGREHIRGECRFIPLGGGDFEILGLNGKAFAYVYLTGEGRADGYWNGGNHAGHAHDPLGPLRRDDACWINDRASVCAW